MIRPADLIRYMLEPKKHLWIDVFLVKETPKAILIIFDDRKTWIPKAWIARIKRRAKNRIIAGLPKVSKTRLLDFYSLAVGQKISIQLSEYHWVKAIM